MNGPDVAVVRWSAGLGDDNRFFAEDSSDPGGIADLFLANGSSSTTSTLFAASAA